ncbi:MAG TPA: hypothetical protein VFK44_08930 [Bacillales bacterium]|nr:hypothetical protein [Bacillales bacterium]
MQMRNNNVWIPIVASVGVGAAAYYSMTKGGKNIQNALQQMVPFVTNLGGATQAGGQQTQAQGQGVQGTVSSYEEDELSIH